jgi:aromatic ring hydroxylase
MRRNVYMDGKLIDRSDPRMEGAVNAMATTYDLVDNPDFKNMKTC